MCVAALPRLLHHVGTRDARREPVSPAATNPAPRRGPRWWDRAIRRGTAILVLELGNVVCGYATIGPNRARNLAQKGEVYELYLKPEYQGIGLGILLLQYIADLLSVITRRTPPFGMAAKEDAEDIARALAREALGETP